jgi:hypothetical protein
MWCAAQRQDVVGAKQGFEGRQPVVCQVPARGRVGTNDPRRDIGGRRV